MIKLTLKTNKKYHCIVILHPSGKPILTNFNRNYKYIKLGTIHLIKNNICVCQL